MRRGFLELLVALALLAHGALAQAAPTPTLPARLGPEARATIERLVDSLRSAGLPTTPLVDKAAEGVLKGADDQRIVIAVRALAHELIEAHDILGSASDATLLGATASALHAGASAATLRRLAHPTNEDTPDAHSLASALVTLVDLVAKNIPVAAATNAMSELLHRRARDDQFVALRSEVEQDVRAGTPPETALAKRIRAHVELLDALPLTDRPIKRPSTGTPPM